MQKNVYMIQADYLHAGTAFLPFATGALIANAKADPAIAAAYRFFPPFIFRTRRDRRKTRRPVFSRFFQLYMEL